MAADAGSCIEVSAVWVSPASVLNVRSVNVDTTPNHEHNMDAGRLSYLSVSFMMVSRDFTIWRYGEISALYIPGFYNRSLFRHPFANN